MNSKIGKRKNDISELKIEPPKKSMKKDELLAQYNFLLKLFNDVREENKILQQNQKKSEVEIENLKQKLLAEVDQKVILENSDKEHVNVSVQTEMITCEECESPAEDIYDLVDHMHREHPLENYQFDWRCEHYEKGFHEQKRLLLHIQYEHNETNKVCRHFLEGNCFFGNECWYSHEKDREIKQIKCMFCDCSFESKSALMSHRKKAHPSRVKQCRNNENGMCQHGPNCWYNHDLEMIFDEEHIQIDKNPENNQIVKKLVDMVENFGKRLVNIENRNIT